LRLLHGALQVVGVRVVLEAQGLLYLVAANGLIALIEVAAKRLLPVAFNRAFSVANERDVVEYVAEPAYCTLLLVQDVIVLGCFS
jgi:hypothetical protein